MLVVIGRIGRAHGIRGELAVDLRTDEPERRFAPGSSVVCAGRSLTVKAARPHSGKLLVTFDQVADRTAAEHLRGQVIEADVDPAELPEDDDAFYDHQLIGLRVARRDGAHVGEVTGVLHLPAHDTLAIDAEGREILVPFVAALVPEVDIERRVLVVADVPGLLDPDAAETVTPPEGR
ncbi:ribosome maturation factor RimM [Aeromicrobium phragmitis]|uniref:Ribosome maturation factor RimM n=1 Tax=Aeromicrobium phragmitis TaxID=2478914 RepID=A0A3L8PQ40_9ACTN|nr:ribosome maturation factor RimM [Aeromicrobium phragmitis]RLV56949.1 ribosome maturation factor RimM [Aeromicrobium phragmitis]